MLQFMYLSLITFITILQNIIKNKSDNDDFLKNPDSMPDEFKRIMARFGIDRAVCDYIAGMTDSYAIDVYENLYIPKGWRGTNL